MLVVNITIAQNEELARAAEAFVSITDKYVYKWRKRAGSRACRQVPIDGVLTLSTLISISTNQDESRKP